MRVGARVDQLRIQMEPGAGPADAALQHMRHSQIVTNLSQIPFTAIFHHAGATDHLQIGNFCQLRQNIVLQAIDECRVSFLFA